MHGVMGKSPGAATETNGVATSRIMLLMLVAMTGVAPISLYMLVPALPVLATTFGRDISIAQMTVSLYMTAMTRLIMELMRSHEGVADHHDHLGADSTLPLTAAIFAISLLCASTMIFIVPRRTVVVSEELIEKAEEEESGML